MSVNNWPLSSGIECFFFVVFFSNSFNGCCLIGSRSFNFVFSYVNLPTNSFWVISPLSFKSMMPSFLSSIAFSPIAKFVMWWPFSHNSGSHASTHVMIFLTSSSSHSILAVPSSTSLSLVFFFIFLLRCSCSATIWCSFIHLSVAPGFLVFPDIPSMSLHDLLIVISITWSKGILGCGLPVSELLKPPCSDTYKQLYFPPLIPAFEHNNSSSFGHNFDNLDVSNWEENRKVLPNILSTYGSVKNVKHFNHFNVSVHKPSHVTWSWIRNHSMLPMIITFLKVSLLTLFLSSSTVMYFSFLLAWLQLHFVCNI